MELQLDSGITVTIGSCPDPVAEEVLPGNEDDDYIYEGPSPNIE